MNSATKHASIIIPTYQRVEGLRLLLQSIARQRQDAAGFQVVVIENHAQPLEQVRQMCADLSSAGVDILLLHQPEPGASNARNLGIQQSSGEWLIFLDDDEEILEGYLATAARLISDAGPMSIFGGQCVPVFEADHPKWVKPEYFYIGYGSKTIQLALGRNLPGGNLILARELLDQIGFYNPKLGHAGARVGYGEETDLLKRAEDAGAVQNYTPELSIIHHIPNSRLTLGWLKAQKRSSAQFKAWYYWQSNQMPAGRAKLTSLKLSYLREALFQEAKLAWKSAAGVLRNRKTFPCWENYFMEKLGTDYSRLQNNLALFRTIQWFRGEHNA